jgi:hypothetical protein
MLRVTFKIHLKKKMPAPADNTRLAFTPFGKTAGSIPIIFDEGACRFRQSKTLFAIAPPVPIEDY